MVLPFAPGTAFTKTWRLKNIGTCTWTTAYSLVLAGGDAIGVTGSVKLPASVAPGGLLDISVKLTAPSASGNYKGLWKLSNASGVQFGIGASGTDPFWVSISVLQTSAVIYDFVANAQYAHWKSTPKDGQVFDEGLQNSAGLPEEFGFEGSCPRRS